MAPAPTTSSAKVAGAGAGEVRALRAELEAHLEQRAKRLNEEITRYPTPIARCDQHLAALLEQRAAIYGRLNWLETHRADVRGLEAFLASPADGADETEEALRARLRGELAKRRS